MADDEYQDIVDRADALEEDEEDDREERGAHRPPSDDLDDSDQAPKTGNETAQGKLEEIEAQLEVIADATGITLSSRKQRQRNRR